MSRRALIIAGVLLLSLSQLIFGLVFYPVVTQEIAYDIQNWRKKPPQKNLPAALDDQFRILIPKIDVVSEVFPNINPFNKNEYIEVLKKGVAQAKGTAFPDEKGNIFIFAHSTDSPLNMQSYNAVFYLINKLETGDSIFITFKGRYYKYVVEDKKIINPSDVNYLKSSDRNQTLTLMTCWPPGTTLKRLLILSQLVN